MRAALAAAALTALALGAAGCLGSGGGSEDEFRSDAEAICVEYDEKIGDIAAPPDITALVESSGQIVALLEQQLDELEELDPPGSLSGQFDDWMQLNEEAIENGKEIQSAAQEGDEERIRGELAVLAEQNEREADRLAHEMGIDECLIEEEEITD